jgi:uncharacterized delta-60 repeat protein
MMLSMDRWASFASRGWFREVARVAAAFAAVVAFASHAQPTPGDFDPSFGSGGRVPSLPISGAQDETSAVAVQRDGKIVMAGTCVGQPLTSSFCVARLNANGTLDASFVGPMGNGSGKFLLPPIGTAGRDAASALVLQADGKIIIAGSCVSSQRVEFCVARLNTNGTWDTSFDGPSGNGNGRFALSISETSDKVTAIALQPDGKIVMAGYCFVDNDTFCVARLNVNGSWDLGFDGPGGDGNGRFLLPKNDPSLGARADALVVRSDFRIVLAGKCDLDGRVCVVPLRSDGSLDTDWPGDDKGYLSFRMPTNAVGDRVEAQVQPDGKLVLALNCRGTGGYGEFCLARLNANGTLDATFDGPWGNGDGTFLIRVVEADALSAAMALQPDGKIVLAGGCLDGTEYRFCAARLHPDGTWDTSFDGPSNGGNGRIVLPSVGSSGAEARALALQPDGKIVIAGSCDFSVVIGGINTEFCVTRLNGGPFGARQCKADIDGDGVLSAATDTLILARVSLGIVGNAITNGINFAPQATRNTWPLIREYLNTQCGMRAH